VAADGPAANRLTLDATLAERDPLRYTPAGIPALDCTLRHASRQAEAGGERLVECEVHAVAFADVAEALVAMPGDRALRCEGFLARRWRTGTSLAMHITRFTELT
jgi:primosomal replication protein N